MMTFCYAVRYKAGGVWHEKSGFSTYYSASNFLATTSAHVWRVYKVDLLTGRWVEIQS